MTLFLIDTVAIFTDKKDFDGMKKAGAFAYELLEYAAELIAPGISTKELSDLIHQKTLAAGARSAPLGYHGFPEACCTSVNEV
ncbi:MAG: M24 family metallopeptidase, partial [Proteobacteria bacterium]|nr:M24 family metallopeptidase [Pseudomonadota bacterium]